MASSPTIAANLSWGDVAVICDSSAEPIDWATMGDHEIIQPPPPPDAVELSEDEDSDESCSSGDESQSSLLHETEVRELHLGKQGRTGSAVSFSTIQIREYSLTIGDHTIGNIMYPISLDWEFAENSPERIDDYELLRKQKRLERPPSLNRNLRAPRLGVTDRMVRLAEVTGRTNRALYDEECTRQMRVMEENRRAALGLGVALFRT